MHRLVALGCVGLSLSVPTQIVGQHESPTKPIRTPNKTTPWIEDKVTARAERPYISTSGYLVLVYTVTNNSERDIKIDFTEHLISSPLIPEATQVFLKLKSPDSYLQQNPKDHFIYFQTNSLPVGLPVSLRIVVGTSGHNRSSWFSRDSDDDRLWKAVNDVVGNVTSIDIFIPDQHLKISLPTPKH